MIPTLEMPSAYESFTVSPVEEDRFYERINNAMAMATVLARYADQISDPDSSEFALISMVADGISDTLMTAIEDYENAVERDEPITKANKPTDDP